MYKKLKNIISKTDSFLYEKFGSSKSTKVLSEYLPKQLSEEETKSICNELVKKIGASSIKDMGKVMGELKKNYSDSIEFSKAGAILKEILNK